jgi:hypothetical protein
MSNWIISLNLPKLENNDRITDGGRWEMHFTPLKTKEEEIKELIKCLFIWKKN